MRFVPHCLRERRKKARHQVFVCLRIGGDPIVTGHASRLVLAHAAKDQIDLVAKIIMQNPMRELGILRNLAQARAGVTQFRKGLQGRLGKLRTALGKLVHPLARNPVESCHLLQMCSRLP